MNNHEQSLKFISLTPKVFPEEVLKDQWVLKYEDAETEEIISERFLLKDDALRFIKEMLE